MAQIWCGMTTHMWLTHSCVQRSDITDVRDVTHGVWCASMAYDSFICDTTHSYVIWLLHMGHDSFTCNAICYKWCAWCHTWYASMAYGIQTQIWCDITPCVTSDLLLSHVPYEWVMSHVNVTSQIWCDITPCVTLRIYMWYASFIWDMTHSYGTWLIHMGHDSFMSHVTCKCVMSHM